MLNETAINKIRCVIKSQLAANLESVGFREHGTLFVNNIKFLEIGRSYINNKMIRIIVHDTKDNLTDSEIKTIKITKMLHIQYKLRRMR